MSHHLELLPQDGTGDARRVLDYVAARRADLMEELLDVSKDLAATQMLRGAIQELDALVRGIKRK